MARQSTSVGKPSAGGSAAPPRSSPSGTVARTPTKAKRSVGAPAANSGGMLRFYTEDSPGLKLGPTAVLVLALAFIGCVVVLHIFGKFTR
eukprot:CAMPEP_0177663030 /NCGR_PEP_ID=MMETSP0447-20121125/19690_1 /TAXON_ID=0 /ORGANISM="Stygamoeba regulata, Strain BSH-02190019" /LENGTH=89 /DNA_ID=CAMNT_0019168803 /DNA_START=35 /DNA_END=304 /DNA_ORIENTATION=+